VFRNSEIGVQIAEIRVQIPEISVQIGPKSAFSFERDAHYGDYKGVDGTKSKTKSDIAIGGILGVDVSIGAEGWLIFGSFQGVSTDAEGDVSGVVPVDPFIANLGAGYRF
jgi:hypothetical protein